MKEVHVVMAEVIGLCLKQLVLPWSKMSIDLVDYSSAVHVLCVLFETRSCLCFLCNRLLHGHKPFGAHGSLPLLVFS